MLSPVRPAFLRRLRDNCRNCFTGETFPENTLPSIYPISQNILPFYRKPNAPNYGPNAYGTTQEVQNTSDQLGFAWTTTFPRAIPFHSIIFSPTVPRWIRFPFREQTCRDFRWVRTSALRTPHLKSVFFNALAHQCGCFSFLRNSSVSVASNHTPPSSLGFQYQPTLPIEAGPPLSKYTVTHRSAIPSPDRRTTIRILFLSPIQ